MNKQTLALAALHLAPYLADAFSPPIRNAHVLEIRNFALQSGYLDTLGSEAPEIDTDPSGGSFEHASLDPTKSISAAPTFTEYMDHRAATKHKVVTEVPSDKPTIDAPIDWAAFSQSVAPVAPETDVATTQNEKKPQRRDAAFDPAELAQLIVPVPTPPSSVSNTGSNDKRSSKIRSSPGHNVGSLLLQRSIQTQLYYLADLRDEPTYMFLRGFLEHNHLDDKGKFNELDGLHTPWRKYLEQLEQAEPFTITVQLAPPRLSAQQKRNPYLAKQAVGRSYEETIDPSGLYRTIKTVARSLEREWQQVLTELALNDRERSHQLRNPIIQTKEDIAQYYWENQQVVAGGEGDDQGTPLHERNGRVVARFVTRVALRRLADELQGLEVGSADGQVGDLDEAEVDAKRNAEQWIRKFSNQWEPRLKKGADDDKRTGLGVPPPGQWQRLCSGAEAEDVTEALWQELPQLFAEGREEIYAPEALAARLRSMRADVCEELAEELRALVDHEFS